jgi:hypothetical protein
MSIVPVSNSAHRDRSVAERPALSHGGPEVSTETTETGPGPTLAVAAGSAPTAEELAQLTNTMWRLDPVQLAAVSGAALGLAVRKARHTVIPEDHWLLKHLPPNAKSSATAGADGTQPEEKR